MNEKIDINQINPADLRILAEIKKRKEGVWGNICRETQIQETAPRTIVMPRNRMTWRMGIAAAMTAIIALGVIVFANSIDNKIDEIGECAHSFTATADMQTGALEDGSVIRLAAGTEIGYDYSGEERVVVLRGQASFDVVRDNKRPFVVRLEGRNAEVEVLGTSFVVDNIDGRDKCGVRVKSGNVRMKTPAQTVDLKYGEMAIVSGSAIEKLNINGNAVGDWNSGLLEFKEANLGEIVEELMAVYPEIKRVSDPEKLINEKKDILVTSKFEKETIENVLKEISLHYGIKIEFDGESLSLSR